MPRLPNSKLTLLRIAISALLILLGGVLFIVSAGLSNIQLFLMLGLVGAALVNLLMATVQSEDLEQTERKGHALKSEALANTLIEADPLSLSVSRALSKGSRQARAYIDNMPMGLLTLDSSGNIQVANLRALQIFQTSIDRVVGRSILEFVGSVDGSETSFLQLKDLLLGKLTESRARRASGELIPIDVALSDYAGFGGEGYILNFADLSQRLEIERMKEEFVHMVSHDLRSPLASISMFLSMVAMRDPGHPLSERDKTSANVANEEAERLIRLVNSLLDMSMIRSGKLNLRLETVDLQSLLQKVAASAEFAGKRKKVAIEVCGDDARVSADADRIYQVVENLVGNAIKYSKRESSIRLSVADKGEVVLIAVEDSGAGIPSEFREKIFERFQQVNETDSLVHGGKGLGLAICKLIIEQHGGIIGVDSEEGQGSKFWFTLPKPANPV